MRRSMAEDENGVGVDPTCSQKVVEFHGWPRRESGEARLAAEQTGTKMGSQVNHERWARSANCAQSCPAARIQRLLP